MAILHDNVDMRFDSRKYGVMLWRRIMYFMKQKHCSLCYLADNTGYTYRGLTSSKAARSEPTLTKAIAMADIFGINLDELCDIRIPVTDVQLSEPFSVPEYEERRFRPEIIDYYRRLCLEDTMRVYKGAGVQPPESLRKALDDYIIQEK